MDRFSPFAPAYIRVLVLPVGQIERSRFLAFLGRLQVEASAISLANVVPHFGDDDSRLSPNAFPKGSLLYNYTTAVPGEQHLHLSPFELFREPLLVLGAVDGLRGAERGEKKELDGAAEYLRERHPRVVHRQLVVLHEQDEGSDQASGNVVYVGNADEANSASLREAVCQLSARFLKELNTYTTALQGSPSIATPGQTARSLQRHVSQREQERRPTSGYSTPSQSTEALSPVDDNGSKPPFSNRGSPATSFDQIPGVNNAPSVISRSDSRTSSRSKPGGRASSQDRVSIQGFGSGGTSQEKLKQRGKARVGIVTGSIHMLAGQWSEAMRILSDNTNKARMFTDHVWHAKGLECIVVCLLLHCWAGLEFQIPSICYPMNERATSHAQRFSVNLPSDFRPAEVAQQASVRRLSTSLPDLLKLCISLYRSGEGALELPLVSISEATIRFCKLLALLHNSGGELDHLDRFIGRNKLDGWIAKPNNTPRVPSNLSKAAMVEMLSLIQPSSADGVAEADHIAILAGAASVYALVGMDRKKAIMLRDMVSRLAHALTVARKRGAAEMGIHPAASLSTEAGAMGIPGITGDTNGVHKMMAELARVYGVQLMDSSVETTQPGSDFFGGDNLKTNILKELLAFCEASPDPFGVLRLSATWLNFLGRNGSIDTESHLDNLGSSREDQTKLTTSISRSIGISKHLGLSKAEVPYWDSFLVRRVEFTEPSPIRAIIDRSKLKSSTGAVAQGISSSNPLLYDPSASRPGTSTETEKVHTFVENEIAECLVTLQNQYDVPVDVESLRLVTDGVELQTSHQPIVLEPLRLQQVSLSVSPCSTGDCKIIGCRVKISGCADQVFPIVTRPWSPTAPTLVKELGQEGRHADNDSSQVHKLPGPEHATVSATVIGAQPILAIENSSLLESSMMLLDGERQEHTVVLRNVSSVSAYVFDIVATSDVLRLRKDARRSADEAISGTATELTNPVVVEPASTGCFNFIAVGKPGVSKVQVAFYYSREVEGDQHARVVTLSVDMTVNAALQIPYLDVMPFSGVEGGNHDDHCILSFDIGNAWPKSLSYNCNIVLDESEPSGGVQAWSPELEDVLAPGAVERIYLPMRRLDPKLKSADGAVSAGSVLLGSFRVTWSGEGRVGEVDVSGLVLSPEALDALFAPPIHLKLELLGTDSSTKESISRSKPFVKVGSFVTLRAKLVNHAAAREPLFVQLCSTASNSTDDVQHDRHVAVAGAMNRVVPPLPEGDETEVDFAVCPLLAGAVELQMVVRPARGGSSSGRQWMSQRPLQIISAEATFLVQTSIRRPHNQWEPDEELQQAVSTWAALE
ncbi:hypothetical protein LTR37_021034 [Vermiconidia calcicola]|uniref:Uncharacterized protein n=1 Tax=Vermiconidia calcicola TaxID=1690605 RepID=A0ACC3M9J9_9PEZI|nr:hypothetical protein LTR37_021034 [Vermiconidia calcicola]